MNDDHLNMTVGQWLQVREEERMRIDPETAEVRWWPDEFDDFNGMTITPGVIERIRWLDEWGHLRQYCFARNPSSELWFGLDELPERTKAQMLKNRWAELYESFLESPVGDDSGLTNRQWLEIRKEEGMRIDPETADVLWFNVLTDDPYEIGVPREYDDIDLSRKAFARNPGSDIWVLFRDLPQGTLRRLKERLEREERHARDSLYESDLPF